MNKIALSFLALLTVAFFTNAAQDFVLVRIIVPGEYTLDSINFGESGIDQKQYEEARKAIQNIPSEPTQGYLDALTCSRAVSKSECQVIKDYIRMYTSPGYNFPSACRGKVTQAYLQAVYYHQLKRESDFDKTVISATGARGICQFMPRTATAYRLTNFFDNRECIRAQTEYMRDIYNKPYINCNIPLGISAYHAGEYNKNIQSGNFPGGKFNTDYVRDIMRGVTDTTGIGNSYSMP